LEGITIAEAATSEAKKTARKRSKKRKPSNRKRPAASKRNTPLPSPVEPAVPGIEESEPAASGGLFGMFRSNPADSSGDSSAGSVTASYSGEPLSAEAERLLSSIPDTIGEAEEDTTAGPDLPGGASEEGAGSLGALLGPEVVSKELLASILKGSFGWIAEWRKRDVYQLDDSRAAMLAEPWAPVLNQWWERIAPSFLMQFSQANPGLVAAVLTTAVVVGPMIGADMKETAKEKTARRSMVREGTSHHAPAAPSGARQAKPAATFFHDMGEAA
jgi:hypothetical protein